MPSSDDVVTMGAGRRCPLCGRGFSPRGRQLWCSAACRQAAFRRRHFDRLPPNLGQQIKRLRQRSTTVYLCSGCGAQYVGEQRCPDCNIFCERVGLGGECPHCSEPVLLADLVPGLEAWLGSEG
jgi:hypothetical protein